MPIKGIIETREAPSIFWTPQVPQADAADLRKSQLPLLQENIGWPVPWVHPSKLYLMTLKGIMTHSLETLN